MKRIINMLAGGENATPLKKGVVYAALGTLVALILAIAILVVSSIAYNLTDNAGTEPENGEVGGDDGASGGGNNKTVEFTTLENISELAEKVETDLVKVGDKRTDLDKTQNRYYYAKYDIDGIDKLTASTMTAVDKMLVDFYNESNKTNKGKLVTDIGNPGNSNPDCNIPLIKNTSAEGTEFTLVTFHDESMRQNTLYSWVFTNAYKYGFICNGDEFQYVGVELATYLKATNDLTPVKAKTADSALSISGGCKAYYVAAGATEIKLPKDVSFCEVIADGANGYIVIYKK